MACKHRQPIVLHKTCTTPSLIKGNYQVSCVLCLTEVICSEQTRTSEKESYIGGFLTTCKSKDKTVELSRNEYLILTKVTTIITEHLNTDEDSYSEQLIEVLATLYGYLPDENIFSRAALNPILFWLFSSHTTVKLKLNMVKLLVKFLERFNLNEGHQSVALFSELMRLVNPNESELSSWLLFCSGSCLRKTKSDNPEKLKPLVVNLIGTLFSMKTDENVVTNGLGCLKIMLYQESHLPVVLTGQFSNLIRALINTGLEGIQSVTTEFLVSMLEDDTRGLAMEFIIHFGIVEFVFDMISPNKKCLRQLCSCLQAISQSEKVLSMSLIPHAMERLIQITDRLKHSDRGLMLDFLKIICYYVQCYSGAMDIFLNVTIQEQFFQLIITFLVDRNYPVFLIAQGCFYFSFKCERIIRPFSNSLLLSLMDALHTGVERHLGSIISRLQSLSHTEQNEMLVKLKHVCTLLLNLIFTLIIYLHKQRTNCLTDETLNAQLEKKLLQLFFGKYLQQVGHLILMPNAKATLMDSFVNVTQVFLWEAQTFPLSHTTLSVTSSQSSLLSCKQTRLVIRKSFVYLLPLFYRIFSRIRTVYAVEKLQVTELVSFDQSTNNDGIQPIKSQDCRINCETLLSMLTISSLAINGIHTEITETTNPTEAETTTNQLDLKTLTESEIGDVQNVYRLLLKGYECISDLEYESLGEILGTDPSHPNFVPLTATALLVGSVLINRSIVYAEPHLLTDLGKESLNVTLSVPEKFIQRMLAFPLEVGTQYFSALPAILVVELLLTFTSLKPIIVARMNPNFASPKGPLARTRLTLLSALVDRITPVHTYILLRCPGFADLLQNAEMTWIKLAQTMIFHCHFQDSLFELKLPLLIPRSYSSLSNIWTVWLAAFLQGDNVKVCRRLSETLIRVLQYLQKCPDVSPDEKVEDQQEAENQFAQYAVECLCTYSVRLPCSLVDFLGSRPELREVYISVLENVINLFSRCSTNSTSLLKLIQQVINLLPYNQDCKRSSDLRHRLLRIILHCLIHVPDLLFVQIIKLFCSSIRNESLRCFYRINNETSVQQHCSVFEMEPMELETILSIGVLILGTCTMLQPASFYEEILNGTIFTDPNFILALIRNDPPGPGTCLIQVASLLCFLLSHNNVAYRLLWPPITEKSSANLYCSLMLCLQTLIMDPVDQFLRYVAIKLFGILLRETSSPSLEPDSLGYLFLTNPWNGIILDLLQSEHFLDPLPNLSIHLLEILTAFIATNNPMALIWVEKHVITTMMMIFLHHMDEYPADIANGIRVFAQTLATCPRLGILNSAEQYSVRVKLNSADPTEPSPSMFKLFKMYLSEADSL